MTVPDRPVLFTEAGSSWWPLAWGPGFGLVGALVELALGGPVSTVAWVVFSVVLVGCALVVVRAKRRFGSVAVTPEEARFGEERLPVVDIAAVDDVGAELGGRVLGGGASVPKGTTDVPLRLTDGSTVVGWARDGDGLRDALRGPLGSRE